MVSPSSCGGEARRSVGAPKIGVSRLWYAVGGKQILKGITATVCTEKVTAVVGPSGAGKSTLLRAMNRLVEPTSGEVYLDGTPTSAMNPLELRRRVGMVFQLPAFFGTTVEDAVLYGARLAGRSTDAGALLDMVGLKLSCLQEEPRNLSIGEQQRVAIARALALEPEVLLMDEPTSALDEATRNRIERLIRELNSGFGLTVVLVSHALDQVERVADRVVLLVAGRSEGEWDKKDFFSAGGERARRYITGGP